MKKSDVLNNYIKSFWVDKAQHKLYHFLTAICFLLLLGAVTLVTLFGGGKREDKIGSHSIRCRALCIRLSTAAAAAVAVEVQDLARGPSMRRCHPFTHSYPDTLQTPALSHASCEKIQATKSALVQYFEQTLGVCVRMRDLHLLISFTSTSTCSYIGVSDSTQIWAGCSLEPDENSSALLLPVLPLISQLTLWPQLAFLRGNMGLDQRTHTNSCLHHTCKYIHIFDCIIKAFF